MKHVKRILFMLLIGFVVIQFMQPARNQSGQLLQLDISHTYSIPSNVYARFKNSCFDCHSNNTTYPWYSNVQPIGWILARDIENGKAMLNFGEFGSLSSRRRVSKLRDVENRIKDGTMPLPGYLLMHPSARPTEEDKTVLIDWIEATIR
jgi:hypothetical protein